MGNKKSKIQSKIELTEEIKSIEDKGFNTLLITDTKRRDKRRFTKIFDIKLSELIFESGIPSPYIHFFILLVNINSRYIEPDLNLITIPIKKIAENMNYSQIHTYRNLSALKENNLIAFYERASNKYVIINPSYYARFYNIKYMYYLERGFSEEELKPSDIVDRIMILKQENRDRKDYITDKQIKEYVIENHLRRK